MPQDWFSQFEAKPAAQAPPARDDWFSQFETRRPDFHTSNERDEHGAPVVRTHRTEDYMDPPAYEGSAAGRFGSNAWELLNPVNIVTGLYGAVRHPIDTGKHIVTSQIDQLRRAGEDVGQGRYSEAAGHTAAGLLPVLGPLAAQAGEQIGSGDIAGGAGKAFGILAPFGVKPVVKGAVRTAARVTPNRVAGALEAGSEARVAEVMSPRANTNVGRRMGNKAAKIAPELAKDPEITGQWSRSGMQQVVASRLDDAIAGLDAASDARLNARTFETAPIVQDLLEKRKQYVAQPVEASKVKPRVIPPKPEEVQAATAQQAHVQRADRTFVASWLANDLREMPFQQGGVSRRMMREAEENYRPGDPTSARYGIGIGASRVAGTPTQQMFHAVGIKGSRAEIAARIENYLAGKADPKLDALSDAMQAAWNGEKFDFNLLSDDAVKSLGPRVRRRDLKSPITPPARDTNPSLLARWGFTDIAEGAEPLYDAATPQGTKVGRPLGKAVVPGPGADRVGMIDQAIAEIRQLGPVARYEDIRKIRQAYDQPAKTVYNPAVTPDYLKAKGVAEGAADVTGALRDHLAKWDPETAAANADFALYKNAHDILKASEEIERVRPKVGRQIMTRLTATIFGGQHAGVPGAIAGYIGAPVVDHLTNAGFTTKLQTAKVMQQLATAIRKGDVGRVASLDHSLRQLLKKGAISTGQANRPESLQPSRP